MINDRHYTAGQIYAVRESWNRQLFLKQGTPEYDAEIKRANRILGERDPEPKQSINETVRDYRKNRGYDPYPDGRPKKAKEEK